MEANHCVCKIIGNTELLTRNLYKDDIMHLMKIDARKLSPDAQEEKRKQAIRLHKAGKGYKEIANLVEVHFETIRKWVRAYRDGGVKAIQSKTRGSF